MITLEKEKVTINPDIKVIKRDGRMVVFDSSKIYEAILKQTSMLSLKNILTIVPSVILSALKPLTLISPLINLSIKTRLLFTKMLIRTVTFTIHNVI